MVHYELLHTLWQAAHITMLEGINYIELYGEEPSAIEQVFAIYAAVACPQTGHRIALGIPFLYIPKCTTKSITQVTERFSLTVLLAN
ncbi:MAG: hypothetical protein K2X86_09365 [Cytophagaceae bacterium]|nr:hypothetical protein [Cytophagaceae bacterium]